MQAGFERILARLVFPILEIHPDNGSEFINHHLLRFFGKRILSATLSRSRPFQKNDNRIVEQKNHTLVRAFFGEARFDTNRHQRLLDLLYDKMWLYYNFFQPVLHLVEKQLSAQEGQITYRRKWDQAQTPLDRLCATSVLDQPARDCLFALRDQTNPRLLRAEIYDLRDKLLQLPLATCPQDAWLIPSNDDADPLIPNPLKGDGLSR